MRTRSSPSLPPRKPTNPQTRLGMHAPARAFSLSKKHLHTPPLTVWSRRTEIAKIDNLAKRRVTFSKRREGLFRKASALCELTDARAAVIVFSSTGKLYSSGDPSVEEIISDYLRCNGDAMSPTGLKEWLDWVEKQRESCVTEEDFDSLILKYEAVLHCVREKLKDISGSGNSGAGVDCDSEVLNDDDIDSLLQSSKASRPSLFDYFKDYVRDGLFASPVNSPVGSGSSGKKPTHSVLEGCEFNPYSSLNLSENNSSVKASAGADSGVGVGHDNEVLYDDEIHSLLDSFEASRPSLLAHFENCARSGVRDSFLTSPVDFAVGGGSLRAESNPTRSDFEGCGFDPDDFLNLSEEFARDDFLTLPENLAVGDRSSGEEATLSDLEGCGYNPDDFAALEDLDVSLAI